MAKKEKIEGLTVKKENLSEWYQQLVLKAGLTDYSSVSGCMILKPYGYAIWENIQKFIDGKIKDWRLQLVEIKQQKKGTSRDSFKRIFLSVSKNVQEFMDETGKVSKGKLRLKYGMNDPTATALKKLLDVKYA